MPMTDREAYNHGYNGTLSLEELLEALPPARACHDYDEPTQVGAWRSGGQDRRADNADDRSDAINEDAVVAFFEEHPEVPACDFDLAARFAP